MDTVGVTSNSQESLAVTPTITLNEGSTNVAPSPVNLRLGASTTNTSIKEPDLYLKEPDISVNMGTDQLASAVSSAANNVTTSVTSTLQGAAKYLMIGVAIIAAILIFKARH
ncbi:MAG: hypothetical protein JRN22_02235 [Nitrososphaerota archaeon]|nr:hypothetical protein [Nitrososphaerota archaeon]